MRYVGGDPLPQQDVWNRVLRYAGHWMLLGYGMFAEIEKASGRYVGATGIADFHRGLGNDCDQAGEAAWVFCADIQGRGYAFEAAKAAHGWFSNLMDNPRTVCVIDPENVPSLALARKLGYDAYGEARYKERIAIKLERCAADLR